jgi:hypothetical protein
MPRGLKRIKASNAEAQARRKAYDEAGPGIRRLFVKDGETVLVRPLEQGDEVWSVYVHELPKKPGQKYGDKVMCLDQDNKPDANCPACNRSVRRSERVVLNVIWYNAPKWKKGADGKFLKSGDERIYDGVEDVVAVWETSLTTGGRLDSLQEKCEQKHGVAGITYAILGIKREGTEKDTKYEVDIEEIKNPSSTDIELYKTKDDPRKVIRSLSRGDLERVYSGGGLPSGSSEPDASSDNTFERAAAGASGRGAFGGVTAPPEAPPVQEPAKSGGLNVGAFG